MARKIVNVIPVVAGALGVTLMGGGAVQAQSDPPLRLEATIPLGNVSGRIDHMAVDLDRMRLMVAELGNNTLGVIDLQRKQIVHRITGLKEPQGVAYLKGPDIIAVANAGDGSVRMYRAADFVLTGTVALGDDADNLRVDPATGYLIAGYGRGALAVIDAAKARKIADIALPAHPEGFRLHPKDERVFVNLPEAHQIAVVDRTTHQPVGSWDTLDARANFPMAISEDGHTVYVVFRTPPRLVLYSTGQDARQASIETCGDADDVFADGKRSYVYVSCGEGFVDVIEEQSDGLQRLGRIPTSPGARTALFVPELDRLFVAARANPPGSPAMINIFKPGR